MGKRLDGSRIRSHLSSEVKALLATYEQFATLVPAETSAGAAHRGEDGRFVEALIRSYLRRLLPRSLEVLTGFVLRPAVKTGVNGWERKGDRDRHSKQLDIIVFDSASYPVFQRYDETVIVPPEGVVALIIKKHLRDADVNMECAALREAAQLCRCLDQDGKPVRGPFLGLLGVRSYIEKQLTPASKWIFQQLADVYREEPSPTFDEVVGYVGTLEQGSMFKARPASENPTCASFVWLEHGAEEHHFALQLLLTGVLSVYFDDTRNTRRRPGYSGFEPGRKHDALLGTVSVAGLR